MMKKDSVAFLGPLGTYSHQVSPPLDFPRFLKPNKSELTDSIIQVTSNYFGDNVVLVPVDRIQSMTLSNKISSNFN